VPVVCWLKLCFAGGASGGVVWCFGKFSPNGNSENGRKWANGKRQEWCKQGQMGSPKRETLSCQFNEPSRNWPPQAPVDPFLFVFPPNLLPDVVQLCAISLQLSFGLPKLCLSVAPLLFLPVVWKLFLLASRCSKFTFAFISFQPLGSLVQAVRLSEWARERFSGLINCSIGQLFERK